ncbi:type IV toxin-antitoxin system AbiEi family antitoxin domain-containing protein [Sedimenticola hydrogenitrophicus]|uniref:type IV toxin-antitoxin system AbiEi family antitoxin domain-containing protein n=1 Tax=Sedimenticola hydrogenitrophicus TaxID=2967975 RepID=UPI0021A725A1|nr:type IV toxin-antitoxin system AbiEi family antitoxin domain-containing protein [Sedimenticola hydrogenitrophicus]
MRASSDTKMQQVVAYLKAHSVVRPRDMDRLGLPRSYLNRLANQGIIEKIGRGLYQWPEKDLGRFHSLVEVAKKAPKSVVALLSALSFHDLTTQNPSKIWLAIDRKAWRPEISYPPVRFVTMSGEALRAGVESHDIGGVEIKVFTPAKTVADCFKYRNKIGLDVALEALREGWSARKFTMDELMRYAEICRVKRVMQPYLESLV